MAKPATAIKLFNKWTYDDVECKDISLREYMSIAQKVKYSVSLPHTAGRYQVRRFRKVQCPLVERLVNSMMRHGRNNGKKLLAIRYDLYYFYKSFFIIREDFAYIINSFTFYYVLFINISFLVLLSTLSKSSI